MSGVKVKPCTECGKQMTAQRSTKLYCSEACKQRAKRRLARAEETRQAAKGEHRSDPIRAILPAARRAAAPVHHGRKHPGSIIAVRALPVVRAAPLLLGGVQAGRQAVPAQDRTLPCRTNRPGGRLPCRERCSLFRLES